MSLKGLSILITLYCSQAAIPVFAQPASDCSADIAQARTFINQSEYEAALPLLNNCLLDDNLADVLRIEAGLLLAKAGIALGDRKGALAAFKDVLRISPLYELDQSEDQEVQDLFNQARMEFFSGDKSAPPESSKDWPWIVVAGGVAAALVVLMF